MPSLFTYYLRNDSKDLFINFCLKCFRGHLQLWYDKKKDWGMKCDTCGFRFQFLQGAKKVSRDDERCRECNSFKLCATYEEGSSPFPGGQATHTGCILCDSILSGTFINMY